MRSLVFNKLVKAIGSHDFPGLRGLLDGFNFYDKERVKEVGPDRAAAEWIVRCDGKVKFDKLSPEFSDYNMLVRETAKLDPKKESDKVYLVSIDAADASISGYGCRHFAGLHHLIDVRFVRCKSLTDIGFSFMKDAVGDHLQYLQVESCPKITSKGLLHVANFKNLKSLILNDLKRVDDKAGLFKALQQSLPQCDIHYPDVKKA